MTSSTPQISGTRRPWCRVPCADRLAGSPIWPAPSLPTARLAPDLDLLDPAAVIPQDDRPGPRRHARPGARRFNQGGGPHCAGNSGRSDGNAEHQERVVTAPAGIRCDDIKHCPVRSVNRVRIEPVGARRRIGELIVVAIKTGYQGRWFVPGPGA
jgi:hypothetical protein